MTIKIEGKCGISATILADSVTPEGVRLTTYEVTYPRIVLAELNTHCMLSRASASSRAIPFPKMVESLTGRPVRFGQANPGMQDKGEDYDHPFEIVFGDTTKTVTAAEYWEMAKESAIDYSFALYDSGYHKQVYNRLTEPFQMMKTVMTATEWNNFFWLRNHEAADPTLAELARCMFEAREQSFPFLLYAGEWHLPYVGFARVNGKMVYYIDGDEGERTYLSLAQALMVSAARCAAVSFRNVDYTLEKSVQVFERLVGDDRKHASAFEHQATPMQEINHDPLCYSGANLPMHPQSWEEGVSHMDRSGQLWSGKLRGYVCHRKLIPGENKEG